MGIETTDIVRALHSVAFGGHLEAEILDAHVAEIGDDAAALEAYALRLGLFAAQMRRLARHSIADHSQDGEFRLLLRELIRPFPGYGVIVDVGANGLEGSNSYDLLSEFGWNGLLIEANPALFPRIRAGFAGTDYTLVECAIGDAPGHMQLHLGAGDAVSSLIEANTAHWGEINATVPVEVRRLGDVLDEHGIRHDFDILSLDIEGMDVPVLNDLIETTSYRPKLIVIEGSYCGQTLAPEDIGLREAVSAVYEIMDKTAANLILRRR